MIIFFTEKITSYLCLEEKIPSCLREVRLDLHARKRNSHGISGCCQKQVSVHKRENSRQAALLFWTVRFPSVCYDSEIPSSVQKASTCLHSKGGIQDVLPFSKPGIWTCCRAKAGRHALPFHQDAFDPVHGRVSFTLQSPFL